MISWRSLLAMCSSGGPTFSATVYQLSPAIPSTWQNTPWNLHPLTVISWQVSQDSYEVNEIRHQEIAGEDLQPKNFQIGLIVTCSQRCIQIRHRRNSRSGFPPHQTTPRVSKAVEPPKVAGLPQPEPTTTTLKLYTYCKLDCFVATHRNTARSFFAVYATRFLWLFYRTKQWSRLYWEFIFSAGIFTTCQPSGAGLPSPLRHLCEQLECDCARTKILASILRRCLNHGVILGVLAILVLHFLITLSLL